MRNSLFSMYRAVDEAVKYIILNIQGFRCGFIQRVYGGILKNGTRSNRRIMERYDDFS